MERIEHGRSSLVRASRWGLACGMLIGVVGTALGFVEPRVDGLENRVLHTAGFVATTVPQALDDVRDELDEQTLGEIQLFLQSAGGSWNLQVDRRSGGMALVEGSGVPWFPGKGNELDPELVYGSGARGEFTLDDLAERARQFVRDYPRLFQVPISQLVFDADSSKKLGDHHWHLVFRQQIDGVDVRSSRVIFRVAHGNLVQFGVGHTIPAALLPKNNVELISGAAAKIELGKYVNGFRGDEEFFDEGSLIWIPRGSSDTVGYTGPVGRGWQPELAYRFVFQNPDSAAVWRSYVSARDGSVMRFVDDNDYADALVRAGVYTVANCADPLNCVPGTASEVPVTMPYADLVFAGAVCEGEECYSNGAGAFTYPELATTATTTLQGKYFTIADGCGAIAASGAAPNDIDLGTSDPAPAGNTDCAPATRESGPGGGPTSGGPGDTHASRNVFYHLNLINQKARSYMPDNEWLKGADGASGPVPTIVNSAPACNAFWQGTTGSLNFQRVTAALSCNNTGENPDVFLHEFGHGLDSNDGTGRAPESATGEALGDTFALLQNQNSCIGEGFRLPDPLDPAWGAASGYGTKSRTCSGVRDLDYTRYCYRTVGVEGCQASGDPDAPNGSRAGLNPDLSVADAGTPARWDHMIEDAPLGVADGQSNFYDCGGPETTGCAGPLNHGCHCESLIPSQANWDLAKRLISERFGGDVYAAVPGPNEVSGWQYMDRLWYRTLDIAVSAYSVTGFAPTGTTNGCAVDNWFSSYRFIDDDNGNLADGTPHADLLFDAFDLHGIACGAQSDASNQPGGCGAPVAAPTISACAVNAPVQLDWTTSGGATEYRVLRNTLGCEFGFSPIGTVSSPRLYFEDAEVAAGVPYYFSVQPVGENASCYGQTSNCIEVIPTTCDASTVSAPGNVVPDTPADNQVSVSWDPVVGAAAYKVYRRDDTCASGAPSHAIAVVDAPTTSFLDDIGLQGNFTYSYEIVASDSSCAACTSERSACVEATTTGLCTVPPLFDGVQIVQSSPDGQCSLSVSWDPGTSVCAGDTVTYNVYRSTDSNFIPARSNLVMEGLSTLSFDDWSVEGGIRYFYIVRAVDAFGNDDGNTVRRSETAVGSLSPGDFSDDAGDTSQQLTPSPQQTNRWATRPGDAGNPTQFYATTDAGNYTDESCQGLETPTIFLGDNPSLSFSSSYDIEPGWDGGYVEVSTEAGGFSNWTKLDSVNYPGVMSGPAGDPACETPGFADGQLVFTGVSAGWSTFSGTLADYANQRVRLRFLFSSDPATNQGGWFIDDVTVTDVQLPGACLGEVSRNPSHPFRVFKRADGNLDLVFEDLGTAVDGYSVYEGTLGNYYSHTAELCHSTSTLADTPNPGDRTLENYQPDRAGSIYLLINSATPNAESILGIDSNGDPVPTLPPLCGPVP